MTTTVDAPSEFARTAQPTRARQSLLVFHLETQAYAISLGDLQEIVPMARLSRPPGSPTLLAGLLDLDRQTIAVVDLNRLFGLAATKLDAYTPILILQSADRPLGLLVDRVDRMASPPDAAIAPIGDHQLFNGCVTGIANIDGETVLLLSTDRILLAQERECLSAISENEERRRSSLTETVE